MEDYLQPRSGVQLQMAAQRPAGLSLTIRQHLLKPQLELRPGSGGWVGTWALVNARPQHQQNKAGSETSHKLCLPPSQEQHPGAMTHPSPEHLRTEAWLSVN